MKRSNLFKLVGASALSFTLVILPSSLPTSALENTEPNANIVNNNRPVLDSTPFQQTKGIIDNWGWLGLLGLLGLLNLFRREPEPVRYTNDRETNSSVTTEQTARYRAPNEVHSVNNEAVRYTEPDEINTSVNHEEVVRYEDPNKVRKFDLTEKTARSREPNIIRRSDTNGKRY